MFLVKQRRRIMSLSLFFASIQYRALAEKASDAFYKLSNKREQIQSYVFDVVRASSPELILDYVFEQKNDIAKAGEDKLEKAMYTYGYEIVQTLIVDIEPDEHVERAMNEINAAARMRVAANEKAESEKILQIKRAEGDAESKYLAGLGITLPAPGHRGWLERQRACLLSERWDHSQECDGYGFSDSILRYNEGNLGIVKVFFRLQPHGPGTVKDIASQIREGRLQANATLK